MGVYQLIREGVGSKSDSGLVSCSSDANCEEERLDNDIGITREPLVSLELHSVNRRHQREFACDVGLFVCVLIDKVCNVWPSGLESWDCLPLDKVSH